MVKNLLTGLWLAIQNCAQEPIHKNFPGVDHAQETGTDFIQSDSCLDYLSRLAIALLNPGSVYETILMEVQSLQALGWKIEENRLLYIRRDVKTFN
jgi:hypothetical protein